MTVEIDKSCCPHGHGGHEHESDTTHSICSGHASSVTTHFGVEWVNLENLDALMTSSGDDDETPISHDLNREEWSGGWGELAQAYSS